MMKITDKASARFTKIEKNKLKKNWWKNSASGNYKSAYSKMAYFFKHYRFDFFCFVILPGNKKDLFNRLRAIWPKGCQRGSLGKSH